MAHVIWTLHDLVYGFTCYMNWYCTWALVLCLTVAIAAVSFLFRSWRSALIAASTMLTLIGVWQLCVRADLEWKLYCYAMHGRWHI